jgi:uroporphyrinogen-III synthase
MRRVVLTRPEAQASAWRDALAHAGWQVWSLPLIEIAAASDEEPRLRAIACLHEQQAIMFVSSPAVQHFFTQNNDQKRQFARIQPAHNAIEIIVNRRIRCWATGLGTVASLLQCGVPRELIDAPSEDAESFDSEGLWQRVSAQIRSASGVLEGSAPDGRAPRRVLIVRGTDVGIPSASRDWLAEQIRAAGGRADVVSVYERRAPQFSREQVQQALSCAQDGSIWLLSSSQAVRHLPSLGLQGGYRHARALCTHPRIAQAAHAAGFGVVQSTQPLIADVLRGLESLHVSS